MDLSSRDGRREQGARIQAAAEAAGLSLAELAHAIGCSRALIYQYVSGQVLAQADRVQAIAALFGRPLAWFYTDSPEEHPTEPVAPVVDTRETQAELARESLVRLQALAAAQSGPPDFAAAKATCQRLLEAAISLDDPAVVTDAEFRLGHACYALGDLEGTRAAMLRAVEGYRVAGRADRERLARQTLGAALAGLGERDRALAEFEAVIAGGEFNSEWRGRLGRADVYEALGRGEAALAELEAAQRLIEAQPPGAARAWAELYVQAATVNVYLLHDDYVAAEAAARQCAPLAEELADIGQHVEARINLGFARRHRLDWAGSLAAYDDAARLARLTGDRERGAVAMACRADLLAALGRIAEARTDSKAALSTALELGSVRGELLAHLALAEACRRGGEANESLYHAQQALAAASAHNLAKLEATARLAVAAARRALGEPAAAGTEERRAAAIGERIGARGAQATAALGQATAALESGDVALAAERVEEAERLARQTAAGETRLVGLALAAQVRAASSDATGAGDAAEAAVRGWLAVRAELLSAEVEEAILDDGERLTAVVGCLTLVAAGERPGVVAELLDAAAWPPLTAAYEGLRRE